MRLLTVQRYRFSLLHSKQHLLFFFFWVIPRTLAAFSSFSKPCQRFVEFLHLRSIFIYSEECKFVTILNDQAEDKDHILFEFNLHLPLSMYQTYLYVKFVIRCR